MPSLLFQTRNSKYPGDAYLRMQVLWRNCVTDRSSITNLCLLMVLAGILMLSGGLQCAFNCLTSNENLYTPTVTKRVDECHNSVSQSAQDTSCPNKACHQGSPHHRNLGDPEFSSLHNLNQPIINNYREPTPQYRVGTAFVTAFASYQPSTILYSSIEIGTSKNLQSIRSTILII